MFLQLDSKKIATKLIIKQNPSYNCTKQIPRQLICNKKDKNKD